MKFQSVIISFIGFLFTSQTILTHAKYCASSSKEKYLNPTVTSDPGASSFMKELMFMAEQPLAYWYEDRSGDLESSKQALNNFVSKCGNDAPMVVIYGIPGKDCGAGESSSGYNTDNSYKQFITNANDILKNNKDSIIILEPDATALTIDGNKCGQGKNYKKYLSDALSILEGKVYLDVGHWIVIYGDEKIKQLTDFVSSIDTNNKLKGFSLNLSNYRKTEEMVEACRNIKKVSGKDYKCLIDTSRNNNGPSSINTWCNYNKAGIGISASDTASNADMSIIDSFIWIKPAAELDGSCYGGQESYTSSKGAGAFDLEWLKLLWKQGYYNSKDISSLTPSEGTINTTPASTPDSTPASTPDSTPASTPPASIITTNSPPTTANSPSPNSNAQSSPDKNINPQKNKYLICKS